MKKISEQLFEVATMLMQTFNPNKVEESQWKKYKSKQNDFRNVYFISDTMLEYYSDDKVFQNALKNGYLIFEDNTCIL